MKKKIKVLLSLCMIFTLALTFAVPAFVNAADDSTPNKHYQDWMSLIPDKTKISSISIPGTHDSATQYCTLPYCTSCQDTSIKEQLNNGYRYIDARYELNSNKDGFIYNHGGFKCKESFWPWAKNVSDEEVYKDLYQFLQDNPTETVILAIKLENSNDDVATAQRIILNETKDNPDKWYTKNTIPTLGEVRGKIVLATRFDDVLNMGEEANGLNFNWTDQGEKEVVDMPYALSMMNANEKLWVQDRYKYSIQSKFDAFKDGIENCQASDDAIFINFLSLSGQGLIPHPKGNADSLNRMFKEMKLQNNTSYGIIVLDRADKEMAAKVFETNF